MGAETVKLRPLAGGPPPKPGGGGTAPGAGAAAAPAAVGHSGLRIIKFFVALALIPLCVGMTQGVHDHFFNTWSRMNIAVFGPSSMLRWFAGGAGLFALVAILLWRPVVVYVFAHELVHALATWLCLGKVTNLTATARGGQVTTSKSNTFIRLAPYCVPFYALLVGLLFCALNAWWRPLGDYVQWLALALGFFYAFHLGFTLWSLRRDQPDLKTDGWLFSLVLIYLCNLTMAAVLLSFLGDASGQGILHAVRDCASAGWGRSEQIYRNIVGMAQDVVRR